MLIDQAKDALEEGSSVRALELLKALPALAALAVNPRAGAARLALAKKHLGTRNFELAEKELTAAGQSSEAWIAQEARTLKATFSAPGKN